MESVKPEDNDWDKVGELIKSEYGINEKIFDKAKRIYTKWILLEHSDVPIPSNMNALNIAVGKGLEIKSQELIDDLNIEITDEEDKSVNEIIDEIDKEIEVEEEKQKEIEEMFNDEFITKPEETPDYIRLPAKGEAGKHDGHKIRTMDIDVKQGIKALYCVDCKKMITFLFDKAKGWDMAKAKKWMADHGKDYDDFVPKEETESHKTDVPQPDPKETEEPEEKKEPSKGFSLDEIPEIIEENKYLRDKIIELLKKIDESTFGFYDLKGLKEFKEMEALLKIGAVLNRKNKQNLKNAQNLIQEVLDSAETAEPTEEGKEIEIEIEDEGLEIEEKETEKESDVLDIDEKELVEIIHSALEEHINKSVENVSKNIKQDIDDNFKRLTGKVM